MAIELSPSGPVEEGTEVTVTMSFGGLERDSDPSDVDYNFRADVKDSANGNADGCEDQKGGYGLGVERYMKQVDEDPEVRTGTVSASCAPGDYTVKVSIFVLQQRRTGVGRTPTSRSTPQAKSNSRSRPPPTLH